MTDRLPAPMADAARAGPIERASATPSTSSAKVRSSGSPGAVAARPSARRAAGDWIATPRGLADVEEWMVGAITSIEDPRGVDAVVSDGPRQTASERFEVYRRGYRARLAECLADDYPVLAEVLGAESFEDLCLAYVDRHPSSSPNLNFFGRHMERFCRESQPLGATHDAAFLSELAALEWALVESIHAEASEPLDAARLQALRPEEWSGVRFVPSGSVALLKFQFPVNAYYQARRTGGAPDAPDPGASATAVYRKGLTVWRMDLTPAMTRVLEALLGGVSLGDALGRIGVDETGDLAVKEAERSVMIWFREWVAAGFFRDFFVGG